MTIHKRVLMIDDSPGDIVLAQQAFSAADVQVEFYSAKDAEVALDILRKKGGHPHAPRPHLILLDLNLPRMTGFEFLKVVRDDPVCASIPIIVLSISIAQGDVEKAYRLGANAYVAKPLNIGDYQETIQAIDRFWFHSAVLNS